MSASSTASAGSTGSARSAGSYGRGARILSIGIASTGLLTFAYFSIASHVLEASAAKRIDVLWSVMFVTISVIYRPIEQLLSRTIAEQRARGRPAHGMRVPILIQAGFALAFLVVVLALQEEIIEQVFESNEALYYVLIVGTLAYAASYFARGWLAGHERFALFGGLVLMESTSRLCFALAVAIGLASGQTAVALGIAAAPIVSLIVVPLAFARRGPDEAGGEAGGGAGGAGRDRNGAGEERKTGDSRQAPASSGTELQTRTAGAADRGGGGDLAVRARAALRAPITVDEADAALAGPGTEGVQEATAHDALSLRRGGGFAIWVSGIMLSEQALLNAAVLTVDATSNNRALAGIVFNVLLIARAPLQLFQAIQTSLLPHLTGLETTAGHDAFARAVRITVRWIAAFAAVVTIGLLTIGPWALENVLFGQEYSYKAGGLALIGIGMGLHLISGALNQAALARDRAGAAAACWIIAAALFVGWMFLPAVEEQLLRAELGYAGATALLALGLWALYRQGSRRVALRPAV